MLEGLPAGGFPGGGRYGFRGGGLTPSLLFLREPSGVLLPASVSRCAWRRTTAFNGELDGGGPRGGARRGCLRELPAVPGPRPADSLAAAIWLRRSLERSVLPRGSSPVFPPAPRPSVFSWTFDAKSMCHDSFCFPSPLICARRTGWAFPQKRGFHYYYYHHHYTCTTKASVRANEEPLSLSLAQRLDNTVKCSSELKVRPSFTSVSGIASNRFHKHPTCVQSKTIITVVSNYLFYYTVYIFFL